MTGKEDTWSAIFQALTHGGVDYAVGVPADDPGLLDLFDKDPTTEALWIVDERAAPAVVAGVTRLTGRLGCISVETGPSFLNSLAMLSELSSLQVPTVVVSTVVSAERRGRGAFQELPDRQFDLPMFRWMFEIRTGDDITWACRYAIRKATGRYAGPALLLVPHDLESSTASGFAASPRNEPTIIQSGTISAARELAQRLDESQCPLIIAGGGSHHLATSLVAFAEKLAAPVLTTASGRGAIDERDPCAAGLVGLYGERSTELIRDADTVVLLGSQMEETARLGFVPNGLVVHVDHNRDVFDRGISADISIEADVHQLVDSLVPILTEQSREDWGRRVAQHQMCCHADAAMWARSSVAARTIAAVSERASPDTAYIFENGLHDMWAYHWPLLQVGAASSVTPGEQTMMGFGLPAAVGVAWSTSRPTVLFSGDSALEMHLSCLSVAAEYGLSLAVVMFDNEGLGWPRYARRDTESALASRSRLLPIDQIFAHFGGRTAMIRGASTAADLSDTVAELSQSGLSLLRVEVADSDIPPCVRRWYGK